MITLEHAVLMARYNRWQNQAVYATASQLTDAQRKSDRGAFFKSIHGTLAHLVFGDQMWMHRFTKDTTFKPRATSIEGSVDAYPDWHEMQRVREDLDDRIVAWSATVDPAWLASDVTWFSGSLQRDVIRPAWLLVTHMFNHQTHHRGQVHTLLTGYGLKTTVTDLAFLPEELLG
jgi:uncharacterized damage-inducible protein DinB